MPQSDTMAKSVDRRTFLAAMASVGAASIGGCFGDDVNEGDHGERVPELIIEFAEGLGNFSETQRDMAKIASNNLSERLGIPVEAQAKEFLTLYEERTHDSRNAHLYTDANSPNPGNLDPTTLGDQYHIQYAGNIDGFNPVQYHSCEYSQLMEDARFAEDDEEFDEVTTEAMQIFSEDIGQWLIMPLMAYDAVNTDHIAADEELLGEQGISGYNYDFRINMEAAGDVTPSIEVDAITLRTRTHPMIDHPNHTDWANLIHSPLYRYDQNYDFKPVLAEDSEVTDEFRTVTITIRDATFHNGDPITAEDVKFTWDLYYSSYDNYVGADTLWEIDSIEVIDEETVQWNFPVSTPAFMERGDITGFGILSKDIWEGKLDNDFSNLQNVSFETDEVVGSGPYELDTFQIEQFALLTAFEDHFESPNQDLRLQAYTDGQAAYRDFQQGELSIFAEPNGSQIRELQELDHVSTRLKESMGALHIYPQMSFPPFQFREMRLACSQVLNREEMNQVTQHGDSRAILESNIFSDTHPEYPEEGMTQISPSPVGSEEAGRETLRDAGYTWDNNGRLRYPQDKDLTPLWPQGEAPMDKPEEWPCVEEIPEEY